MRPYGYVFFRLLFSGRVVLDRALFCLRRLVRVGANDGREALVFAFFGYVRVSVLVFERRRKKSLLLERRRRRGIRVARKYRRRRVRRLRERRVFSPVVRESFGGVRCRRVRHVPFLFFCRTRVFFRPRVRLRRVFGGSIRARRKSRLLFLRVLVLLVLLVLLFLHFFLLNLLLLLLLLLIILLLQRHLRHRVAHLANFRLGVREERRRERERRLSKIARRKGGHRARVVAIRLDPRGLPLLLVNARVTLVRLLGGVARGLDAVVFLSVSNGLERERLRCFARPLVGPDPQPAKRRRRLGRSVFFSAAAPGGGGAGGGEHVQRAQHVRVRVDVRGDVRVRARRVSVGSPSSRRVSELSVFESEARADVVDVLRDVEVFFGARRGDSRVVSARIAASRVETARRGRRELGRGELERGRGVVSGARSRARHLGRQRGTAGRAVQPRGRVLDARGVVAFARVEVVEERIEVGRAVRLARRRAPRLGRGRHGPSRRRTRGRHGRVAAVAGEPKSATRMWREPRTSRAVGKRSSSFQTTAREMDDTPRAKKRTRSVPSSTYPTSHRHFAARRERPPWRFG